TGYQKADRAASGIAATRTQLDIASRQIGNTIGSMMALMNADPANAEELFKKFSKDIDAIEKQAAKVRNTADKMHAKGNEYFVDWEQESALFQNPDLKEQAVQRREELQSYYGQIDAYLQATKEAYRPFIGDLRDVERYFSNDLTPAGRSVISDQVQKTAIDGEKTQRAVDNAINIMNQVAARLSSS
ncbi:MAG: DUF2959 family protein, partial [Pseudomonadota bacterium]|nr:DUF2959 family protein [Pseudomonadota bacterium]